MSTMKAKQFHLIEDLDISVATLGLVERIEAFGRLVAGTVSLWASRSRERRQLAQMSDRLLQDVGLNRVDVNYETNKFFWQK